MLRAQNRDVDLYLMATWSRADQVYPAEGAWAGRGREAMAADIRAAYDAAAAGAGATVIPVGDAWNRAMRTGVADPNPYDGIDAGKLDLWTFDHYHASTHGYYLEALVIFGRLTGRDPRSLGRTRVLGVRARPVARRGRGATANGVRRAGADRRSGAQCAASSRRRQPAALRRALTIREI